MQVEQTMLTGVLVVTPQRYGDDRGWFAETFNAARMAAAGIGAVFVQDNHSMSARVGTLRGLHYQKPPHAQDKLVRCSRGVIFDVAVDIRVGSPTYGKWVGVELTAENGKQLLVPKGFAHGFVTRAENTEVQYKCSDVYAPDCDAGVRWNDPDIGIDWGLGGDPVRSGPVLSGKDLLQPFLKDTEPSFTWQGR